jgi:serine/threonine protein kinase
LEVLENSEAFTEEDGDLAFSHTKVVLKGDSQYFYAISNRRYRHVSEIDPFTLDLTPIHGSQVWPVFPANFTRAPEPLPQNCYIKRPTLLYYGDTKASTEISTVLLHEAQICEILKKSPHPSIAKYLGCLVDDGRITGLCFLRYRANLSQIVRNTQPFDRKLCLRSIRLGIEHLHKLRLIHCDINPANILSDGDSFVISDFDSCTREGDELGLKAGTRGWTKDDFRIAKRENDLYGLSKIEEFLSLEAI